MILLLGGTKDSRLIAEKLIENQLKTIITTTTDYGTSLLPNHELLIKKTGKYDHEKLIQLIKEYDIDLVIDATHPYAVEVSKNIIAVSQKLDVLLFRYERPREKNPLGKYFESYEEMIDILKETDGKILLTIGSKDLDLWSKVFDIRQLMIRVLPMTSVINKCHELGFLPNQIIAIQGPFSKAFNKRIIKDYQIKYLITKDTGAIGGFNSKVDATLESNIQCFIKERPKLAYFNKFDNIKNLISNAKFFI